MFVNTACAEYQSDTIFSGLRLGRRFRSERRLFRLRAYRLRLWLVAVERAVFVDAHPNRGEVAIGRRLPIHAQLVVAFQSPADSLSADRKRAGSEPQLLFDGGQSRLS